MRIKTRTTTYKEFDVGEYVRRTSARADIDDVVHQVVAYHSPHPEIATDEPMVDLLPLGAKSPHVGIQCEFLTGCDANGWRADEQGPWDADDEPGAPGDDWVERADYEAAGMNWPEAPNWKDFLARAANRATQG